MSQTIDTVYRDYNTAGVPASGDHKPRKADIRSLLKQIQNSSGLAVTRNTLAALQAVTPTSDDYMGVVLADPTPANNGFYSRVASAWVKGRGLPDTFAELASVAGTNTVTASYESGVNPSDVQVFFIEPISTNTGAVTLNGNPVRNVNGDELAAGEWTAGRLIMLVNRTTEWRLLSDPDADGAAASAAASADIAVAAAIDAQAAVTYTRVSVRGTTTGVGPYDMGVGNTIGSPNNLDVKIGGIIQDHDTYTVAGTEFTFTVDPGAGIAYEAVLQSETRELSVPAAGSVTRPTIAPQAVGTDEIEPASITEALLGTALIDKINAASASGQFNVLDYGASEINTNAANRVALQAAIDACDAAGGGVVVVPWPIDYGHAPTDPATFPDFTGVVNDMSILDDSPSSAGFVSEGSKQGWQSKRWMHTPQTTPEGQHDGNGTIIKADWHPWMMVDANPEVIAFGDRPAGYNYRASYFWGLRGKPVYQLNMGSAAGDELDSTLKGLQWICYDDDVAYHSAILSYSYAEKTIGYGVATTLPSANHHFRSQNAAYYAGMFESLGTTCQVTLRNSDGVGDDVLIENTNGGMALTKVGTGSFISFDASRNATTGGGLAVSGALSKSSGTFDIPHPDPAKMETHRLRHSFVESPTRGDNIYRFTVEVGGDLTASIALPDYWPHLNENPQVWINAACGFGRAYGEVSADHLSLEVTADAPGTYNVLLIGTRCDEIATANFDPLGVEYAVH